MKTNKDNEWIINQHKTNNDQVKLATLSLACLVSYHTIKTVTALLLICTSYLITRACESSAHKSSEPENVCWTKNQDGWVWIPAPSFRSAKDCLDMLLNCVVQDRVTRWWVVSVCLPGWFITTSYCENNQPWHLVNPSWHIFTVQYYLFLNIRTNWKFCAKIFCEHRWPENDKNPGCDHEPSVSRTVLPPSILQVCYSFIGDCFVF